jgi:SAM-dependent methyltransferase
VLPGARLLDAGCGTGRYAAELSRRGYVVEGVDLSPDLIAEARRAHAGADGMLSYQVGDLTTLPANRYDAILCRGVLNDLIDDRQRRDAFDAFRRALRDGGALVLDVREWDATLERKRREPLFRKSVDTDRGKLTFTSVTSVDEATRRLILAERHTLDDGNVGRSAEYEFLMRCWTREELDGVLRATGFADVDYFGAYDRGVSAGATDRLVVIASCRMQIAN